MEQQQTTVPAYAAPVVLDAGEVTKVTLGSSNFDTADESEYVKSESD